jgi:hypothetical protein
VGVKGIGLQPVLLAIDAGRDGLPVEGAIHDQVVVAAAGKVPDLSPLLKVVKGD